MADERQAEQHRRAQETIAATAAAGVPIAWGSFFDLHDLRGSSVRLVPAIRALVDRYGRAGASVALAQYRNDRRAAGVGGRAPVRMPSPTAVEDITSAVGHVLAPLYGAPDDTAVENAKKALESSVEQMVLDQSRTAVIEAVGSDPQAKGWARVTEPGACYFCALLATRGAVYKSEATASFQAHRRYANGTGGDCRCHAEPFFNVYEPTAQARQWMADHARLKEENGGHLSLLQWRRAYEGRDGTNRSPLADSLG